VLTDTKIDYEGASYWKEKYGLDIFKQAPRILQRLLDCFNGKDSTCEADDELKFLSS
jgi:hypothetical protein